MITTRLLSLLCLFCLMQAQPMLAQKSTKKTQTKSVKVYPESFSMSLSLYDKLFSLPVKSVISAPDNKYLDKAVLMLSSKNGDMQLLNLKLAYFATANLMIQVSGTQSTQIFILSDNNAVFYKGVKTKDGIRFSKCSKDDIVNE